jgi:uncharacterized protein (DUF1499 family)
MRANLFLYNFCTSRGGFAPFRSLSPWSNSIDSALARRLKSCFQTRFLVLLLALGGTGGCSVAPDRPAGKATLAPCGWLPNCVNSASGRGLQAVDPIRANDRQWQALKAWIVRQPDWEIVIDDICFIQAVVKTPLMRFRDDVQLQLDMDSKLIHVRSSSRLGFSDLGTNYRRVEALRKVLYPVAASRQTNGATLQSRLHD